MVIWNRKVQLASSEELKKLQLKLLRKQINRVYERSKFYRVKFKEAKLKPTMVKSLDDVKRLPLTSREELEENYHDILAVPLSEVATIRLTSGTTGRPLKIAHTRRDVEMVSEASARKLTYHGVTSRDVVQVTASYGLWQGAWSVHWGAEKIGACVIPVGPGDTERQILLIKQFGTTVLYGVTNYHLRILEVAKALGEDLSKYNLKLGICVAEKPSKSQIRILEKEFGYQKVAIDYGATEFPGFSVHCEEEDSHHVWGDYYLVEVVDPETHEPLGDGGRGELVITSLQREAFPLIRYLSRDVTNYFGFHKCKCGMAHPKVGVDIDREDFMTKIRGVAVFPGHVEFILSIFPELTGRCQIIADKRTPKHEATLKVEVSGDPSMALQKSLRGKIVDEVKNRVGITFNEVIFVPVGTFEGKFKKAIVIT
ncbi:MAG: AMP-binding protein [Candidatus Bathyarchaeota archaeon]|nr:AMP-binding protein [Candidatus Bathyarchaeota archaeon]MDH5787475.1 AMP-binding protein [Candidatus Bathyarchaeota archaeon]